MQNVNSDTRINSSKSNNSELDTTVVEEKIVAFRSNHKMIKKLHSIMEYHKYLTIGEMIEALVNNEHDRVQNYLWGE